MTDYSFLHKAFKNICICFRKWQIYSHYIYILSVQERLSQFWPLQIYVCMHPYVKHSLLNCCNCRVYMVHQDNNMIKCDSLKFGYAQCPKSCLSQRKFQIFGGKKTTKHPLISGKEHLIFFYRK